MSIGTVTNNAYSTLASGITNVATSLSVGTGEGSRFPAAGGAVYFWATLTDASNNIEVIKVTSRSTDVLTIVRGQDGTSARAWNAGDSIELRIPAALLTELKTDIDAASTHIAAAAGAHAATAISNIPAGNIAATTVQAALNELDGEKLAIANALSELTGTQATARTNIGAAASGANTDITSLNAPALGAATATTQGAADNTTKVATTAMVQSAIAAIPSAAFTKSYTSADQTITAGGSLTLAHSLGGAPVLMQAYLVAQNSVLGYTAGDITPAYFNEASTSADRGMSVVPDATNINVRFGAAANTFVILRKDTGAGALITNTDWKVRFRAWR